MSNDYSLQKSVADKILKKCARILARDFTELTNLQNTQSNLDVFVSNAYKNIKLRLQPLLEDFPEYGYLINGEALGPSADFNFHVKLDDGQQNFKRAIPFFSVNVTLQEVTHNGEVNTIFTYSHSPLMYENIFACKAKGAFLEHYADGNFQEYRMRIAQNKKLNNAVIVFGDMRSNPKSKLLANVINNKIPFICLGSDAAAISYYASGKADIAIVGDARYEILAKEAGGFMLNSKGQTQLDKGPFVAINEYLQKSFFEL